LRSAQAMEKAMIIEAIAERAQRAP